MAVNMDSPLGEEEAKTAMAKMDTELAFVFDNSDVPKALQAKVAAAGVTTCSVFAAIESDVDGLRDLAKTDLGLDPKAGLANKVAFAKFVNAWETCKVRGTKRKAEEAEQRVGDLPLRLPKAAHLVLTKAFNTKHKELDDKKAPHPDYIDTKLQELEQGKLIAEKMADIICIADDDGVNDVGMVIQQDGTVKARRSSAKKGKVPSTTEGLRTKFKIMAAMWEYVRLKAPAQGCLKDYDMEAWDTYADYLLGESVWGIELDAATVGTTVRPSWQLLMDFDLEFRKHVAWLFNTKGTPLVDALSATYDNTNLYQTKFLTQLTLHAGAAAAKAAGGAPSGAPTPFNPALSGQAHAVTPWVPPPAQFEKGKKGKGKGKDAKGKGKGKDAKGKGKGKDKGKDVSGQICFKFQRGKCNDRNCPRKHMCFHCNSPDHGGKDCPNKAGPRRE